MDLLEFPHSAMFIGVTACGKTEFLLKLLETIYKNHFEFIMTLCPTILDNKTYLSRKWIFDDKNIFIVCDLEGKLNERIKLLYSPEAPCSYLLYHLICIHNDHFQ